MKEKGVLLKKSNNSEEEKAENPTSRPRGFSTRNASSKYDFVKVKVWLGDNADHYYVLSRFLLCRMLTVTKGRMCYPVCHFSELPLYQQVGSFPFLYHPMVLSKLWIPYHVAIKIALELKKLLVDNSLLDVSQSDLEANLFKLMERRGYGEEYINRYKMITRFHHQRVPLVILVCGTACSGKSTIATQLAQRLNLPNVLQTDMVYELLRTSTDAPLASTPVWEREFLSSEELITEFCRECRIVRKGLAGDLKKAMKDGKPIIIEGIHLDPSIYLDGDNKLANNLSEKAEEEKHPSDNSPGQMENKPVKTCETSSGNSCLCPENVSSQDAVISDQINEVVNCLESVKMEETVSEGGTHKIPKTDKIPPVKKERCGAEPIIVPIVLNMAEFDHEALLEEWIATRTYKDKDKLISNLKTIQDYLCKFQSQGLTIVNISPTTFPQTLDWLHSYLLQCIEQGISSVINENPVQPAKS